jgi:hypothetical protein
VVRASLLNLYPMSFKLIGSRTQFELRVGDHHSVDVVLHVRRQDADTMRTNERWDDILLLLQMSILPRMFHDEIEVGHILATQSPVTAMPTTMGSPPAATNCCLRWVGRK